MAALATLDGTVIVTLILSAATPQSSLSDLQ
jgi:hypothetical protein